MDTLLKGISYKRQIGSEAIRITSLGEASSESKFIDKYDRVWVVRSWKVPYDDTAFLTFSLPVPDGNLIMLRHLKTGQLFGLSQDLKLLTGFFYFTYYGSMKEWEEFLKEDDLLPSRFNDLVIKIDYDNSFEFSSPRISFKYDSKLMDITKNSDFIIHFSYFKDNGKAIWDISRMLVGDDKNNNIYFTVDRHTKPHQTLGDEAKKNWENINTKEFPYNSEPYSDDEKTFISSVLNNKIKDTFPSNQVSHIYTLHYCMDGTISSEIMTEKLETFSTNVVVKENNQLK